MCNFPKLTEQELASVLQELPHWSVTNAKLHREYKFASFSLAVAFITAASFGIEKMDHHPEWSNVYNRVTVDLVTHDAQGITSADAALARLLESLASRFV